MKMRIFDIKPAKNKLILAPMTANYKITFLPYLSAKKGKINPAEIFPINIKLLTQAYKYALSQTNINSTDKFILGKILIKSRSNLQASAHEHYL